MWQLYDDLIDGIDGSRRVDYVCCGGWRAWVESQGRAGVASLLVNAHTAAAPSGELEQFRDRPLREVAALAKSWDPTEAAIGVAAINSFYNDAERLSHSPAKLFPAGGNEGDAFAQLLPWAKGKKVATVGHFAGVDQLYASQCELTIFEREPRPGDLPDAAEEYLLPRMDMVFITGMALTNKTLPRLLQLSAGLKVVITGPSLPLTDIMFDFGVDVLSGLSVCRPETARKAVVSARWHDLYACSSKVLWYKE